MIRPLVSATFISLIWSRAFSGSRKVMRPSRSWASVSSRVVGRLARSCAARTADVVVSVISEFATSAKINDSSANWVRMS